MKEFEPQSRSDLKSTCCKDEDLNIFLKGFILTSLYGSLSLSSHDTPEQIAGLECDLREVTRLLEMCERKNVQDVLSQEQQKIEKVLACSCSPHYCSVSFRSHRRHDPQTLVASAFCVRRLFSVTVSPQWGSGAGGTARETFTSPSSIPHFGILKAK
ncbi:calcyclin-binding protein [Silurus meridionalis]|nr:calcyclin-binding protein [Silurus meridionalis]